MNNHMQELAKRIQQFDAELSFTKKLLFKASIRRNINLSEEQKNELLEQFYDAIESGDASEGSIFQHTSGELRSVEEKRELDSGSWGNGHKESSAITHESFEVKPLSFLEKLRLKRQLEKSDGLSPEPESEKAEEVSVEETTEIPATEKILETADSVNTVESKEFEGVVKSSNEQFSLSITLNERQLAAKELAYQGKSFVLIGPAGSGKTTCQRAVAESLLEDDRLSTCTFKRGTGPSIACVAYTRRASRNLERAIHKVPKLKEKLANNVMTIHALLEFEPTSFWDDESNSQKFRFLPKRNAANPLTITHLVIEEASMLGLDLWQQLYDALPYGVQIIFIGDINQLPPVFGPSILNYALLQLPIVELTEVYRNQGIVLDNAHKILKGNMVETSPDYKIVYDRKTKVAHGQRVLSRAYANLFEAMSTAEGDDGLLEYDPEDCIILSPFNKQELGTDNLNRWIAQFLGDRRHAVVHEILAGMHKHYLAVGDKVMYNKRDGVITDIFPNPKYTGKIGNLPGRDLLRFGERRIGEGDASGLFETLEEGEAKKKAAAIDIDYSNFSLEEQKADQQRQASSIVRVKYEDDTEEELSSAGDFTPAVFSLGYVLTVHKAQGSEWRKVFIILHKDHAIMNYRELIYTAATRARTKITFLCFESFLLKGIHNPRIKGNTLAAKLEFFNSGIKDIDTSIVCTK